MRTRSLFFESSIERCRTSLPRSAQPRARLVLLTLGLLAPSVATASPATVEVDASEDAANQLARDYYNAGKYAQCAEVFEVLYERTRDPLYLYNAGTARQIAGDDARAIRLWSKYLAEEVDVSPERLDEVGEALELAKARTQEVALALEPAAHPAIEFSLQFGACDHPEEGHAAIKLNITHDTDSERIHLDHGAWCARATAPEWRGEREFEVLSTHDGAQRVRVTLEHDREAAAEPTLDATPEGPEQNPTPAMPSESVVARDRNLALRLGLASVGLTATSGALIAISLAVGSVDDDETVNARIDRMNSAWTMTNFLALGSGGAGLALGLVPAALTAGLSERPRASTAAYASILAGGVVATASGALAYSLVRLPLFPGFCREAARETNKGWICPNDNYLNQDEINKERGKLALSSALLGLGAGAIVGATVGLVALRGSQRDQEDAHAVRISPYSTGALHGIAVAGRF